MFGGQTRIREPKRPRAASTATTASMTGGDGYLSWARQGRASLPRYALGAVLIWIGWALGTVIVHVAAMVALGGSLPEGPVGSLAVLTATFGLGFLTVPWVVRVVNRRPAWTVITGWWPGSWRHVAVGAAICLGANLTVDLLLWPLAPMRLVGVQPGVWLATMMVGTVGIAIQAGFEELSIRGYLMQAVASRTTRAVFVVGLPATLFAALHWGNLAPFAGNPFQVLPYLFMGLTYGWTAWRTGSLWLVFGLHWANNVYVTGILGSAGDVMPIAAPLVRDLATGSLALMTVMTALTCLLQVVLVAWMTRNSRPFRHISNFSAQPHHR